jgi:hypothetical protein
LKSNLRIARFFRSTPCSIIEILYLGYWSTTFVNAGPFAGLDSIGFAAAIALRELKRRPIDVTEFDHAGLGVTIHNHGSGADPDKKFQWVEIINPVNEFLTHFETGVI